MRSRLLAACAFGCVCLLAVVSNWLISRGHLTLALLLCLAFPAAYALAKAGLAAIAAILVLLTLNGVPGLNLANYNVHGSFEALDICSVALIVLALVRRVYGSHERSDRYSRWLLAWSALFLMVWFFAFFQGWDRGVPVLKAALYGRDFLFFALLAPLARSLVKDERDLLRFVGVLAAMATVYALGEIVVSLGHVSPDLVNARHTLKVGPVTRVYSPMNDLVVLAFACSLAYALLHSGGRATMAAGIASVCGAAVVLQLTRAIYLGLLVGLVIAFVVWVRGNSTAQAYLRRRLTWAVTILVALAIFVVSAAPQVLSDSSVQTVANRVSEGASEVGSTPSKLKHNTVEYRQNVSGEMLRVLGSRWPLGLGFLHPAVIRFPQLPHGSIRNNDLGVFNSLMTMGAIGTILLYTPVLIALACVLPLRRFQGRWDWLRLGGMVWLISVLVGSASLVTLFSPNGLVLTSVLLGAVLRVAQLARREAWHMGLAGMRTESS